MYAQFWNFEMKAMTYIVKKKKKCEKESNLMKRFLLRMCTEWKEIFAELLLKESLCYINTQKTYFVFVCSQYGTMHPQQIVKM